MTSARSSALAREMEEATQEASDTRMGKPIANDVTDLEGYDPTHRVGPQPSYTRDVASEGVTREVESGGSAVTDLINTVAPGLLTEVADDGETAVPNNVVQEVQQAAANNKVTTAIQRVINKAASRINTTQVRCRPNATRFVYAAPKRLAVVINNRDQNNPVFIGAGSAVTENTGFAIDPGSSMTLAVTCELWAVSPAGATLSVIEFIE